MKLYKFRDFINESSEGKDLIDQLLKALNNAMDSDEFYTNSKFEFRHEGIGGPRSGIFDGNLIGMPDTADEESEEGAAIFISSAENFEEIPNSLEAETAITVGNYGEQRTISQNFKNFQEAVNYITKGGIEKMFDWYEKDSKNETLHYSVGQMPDFLKV